jgi:hypothetical protein
MGSGLFSRVAHTIPQAPHFQYCTLCIASRTASACTPTVLSHIGHGGGTKLLPGAMEGSGNGMSAREESKRSLARTAGLVKRRGLGRLLIAAVDRGGMGTRVESRIYAVWQRSAPA